MAMFITLIGGKKKQAVSSLLEFLYYFQSIY